MAHQTETGPLPRERALALVEVEPRDGPRGMAETLHRLCLAVTHDLDLAGATVTLVPQETSHSVMAASSEEIRRIEELQFAAGEGPSRQAYMTGEPMVVPRLQAAGSRWPEFTQAAVVSGISSVASLPLGVGAARLGTLTLYWRDPSGPSLQKLRTALVFADLATELLIDSSYSPTGEDLDPGLQSALQTHGHIYQAQGMVMVTLGVHLPEALARMRAYAFATGQDLGGVADQIIEGDLVMTKDVP